MGIAFSLLLVLPLASCAPLPDIKEADNQAEIDHKPPEIVGSHGELPPQKSKAILDRLKRKTGATEILERNIALVEAISGSPLVAGNRATLLIDGPTTYDAMLRAIRQARD